MLLHRINIKTSHCDMVYFSKSNVTVCCKHRGVLVNLKRLHGISFSRVKSAKSFGIIGTYGFEIDIVSLAGEGSHGSGRISFRLKKS